MRRLLLRWVVGGAALAAVQAEALAWQPKDNRCSICPSCCAPRSPSPRSSPPSGGGGNYNIPTPPPPSRDPQRLSEMLRNEKAAEDAWGRGDADESERLLRSALILADDAGDRARIQGVLDRIAAFKAAERERKAREERDRQRAQADADFNQKIDDMLHGYKADFDGSGNPLDTGSPIDNRPEHVKGAPIPPRQSPPPTIEAVPRPPEVAERPDPVVTPSPPTLHSPRYTAPPPPMISGIPPAQHVSRGIEETLNKAGGNPVDAQFRLGVQSMQRYPNGDPAAIQEQLSYLAGMARSYVGGGGRSRHSPNVDPTQDFLAKLKAGGGGEWEESMRQAARIRGQWQGRRNEIISWGTKVSPDGSLEGTIEVLSQRYRDKPDSDVLNAIRYLEGSRSHVDVPRR